MFKEYYFLTIPNAILSLYAKKYNLHYKSSKRKTIISKSPIIKERFYTKNKINPFKLKGLEISYSWNPCFLTKTSNQFNIQNTIQNTKVHKKSQTITDINQLKQRKILTDMSLTNNNNNNNQKKINGIEKKKKKKSYQQ